LQINGLRRRVGPFFSLEQVRQLGNFTAMRLAEGGFMRLPLSILLVLLASAPALADIDSFTTPSGNIYCTVGIDYGVPADIECTIFERSGPPAIPRRAGCNETLGHQFSMRERGVVKVACGRPGLRAASSGDNVMRYGETPKVGGIACRSSKSGLECRNTDG
jgi:hypothetical protein